MTHDNVTDIERRLQDVYGKLTPGAIETADLDGMAFTVDDAITDLATIRKQLENAREALGKVRECALISENTFDGQPPSVSWIVSQLTKMLPEIDEALKGQPC